MRRSASFLTAVLALAAPWAQAAVFTVQVNDAAGRPLADAVAQLEPAGGRLPVRPMADVQVSQSQRRFEPRVTLVTTGTRIAFPNFDTVRHHVYSFAPTKFELKLYAGVPEQPVLFDKPGIAVLGCNIHDRMAAWIVVADTPFAARTGANGRATIADVPAGDYRLLVWHPGLPPNAPPAPTPLRVADGAPAHVVALPIAAD